MAETVNDLRSLSSNLARRLASRQLPAMQEYSSMLKEYAEGRMDDAQFGKSVLNLGYREATRSAEDLFNLGLQFYSSIFSAAGINLGEAITKASKRQEQDEGGARKKS